MPEWYWSGEADREPPVAPGEVSRTLRSTLETSSESLLFGGMGRLSELDSGSGVELRTGVVRGSGLETFFFWRASSFLLLRSAAGRDLWSSFSVELRTLAK